MENIGIVQTYVFHDPPINGLPHKVRATCTALVAEGGEVFIGVSVCSEAEQFTKLDGRIKSWAIAHKKFERWLKGRQGPDTVVPIPASKEGWSEVNKLVKHECLYAQLEKFRDILSDRAIIIAELEKTLTKIDKDRAFEYALGRE